MEHLLLDQFSDKSKDLFQNVRKINQKKPAGHRYSQDTKKIALTLHFCSPKAYKYCREILHLPSPRSLSNWISNVEAEPGFFKNVFKSLESLDDDVKDCNLVLDGMSIREQILIDKVAQK